VGFDKRIVIAGGSGFIGSALARDFSLRGHAVVVLTRKPQARTDGVREVAWDGQQIGEWISVLDGAEAVINLTGKSINCPHTLQNLGGIISSRIDSVRVLAEAMEHIAVPPSVWVQASAVGFYGDAQDRLCGELEAPGSGPLADLCCQWEDAFGSQPLPHTRKATLRIGFALGSDGGALPVLASLARLFLGGAAGNGRQYISWIHLVDLVRMFETIVTDQNLSGVFNAVVPNPVTNAEFMRELRRVFHRPWSPPVPKFAVKFGAKLMGGEPSLALTSHRCVPQRMLDAGFEFRFPELAAALRDLCRS
jgi:uncharacterized protein (TIGR01777 family)